MTKCGYKHNTQKLLSVMLHKKEKNLINITTQFYMCQVVRKSIKTTINMASDLEKDLKFACGIGCPKG